MTTAARTAPHHRSLYCVKEFGCQLPACRERNRIYTRNRYRQKGYGTWQPMADAQPVRDHIRQLNEAGASMPAIAKAAHVSTATIARVMYGVGGTRPSAKMRHASAIAILSVHAEDCELAAGARVDAAGTRRRIQALVAAGWSFTALSPLIGIHPRTLGQLARAGQVTAGTARKVTAAYKRLVLLTPEQGGVHNQARALARRVATREGWVLPGAWDDIDDPSCEPDLGPEDTANRDELGAYRRQEIAHLVSFGIPEHEIGARLGMSPNYVHNLIRDRLSAAA